MQNMQYFKGKVFLNQGKAIERMQIKKYQTYHTLLSLWIELELIWVDYVVVD